MAEKSDGHDTSELARRSTSPEDPDGQHDPPVRKEADHTDVRAIFRQWDPTGRGMIRKDELLSTFSGLGLHMGERELSLMLEAADMSGDESVHCGKFLRWIFAPASSSESGHQANVSSQDVQTELNISVPGLGSKSEAEADEIEIENCGDILQAAKEGNVGAVRRLLQVDPQSLEQVDGGGDGPLANAARKGHLEVVQVLLAASASVEAKNRHGSGPLAWAAEGGHLEVVQALLAAGASVEAKNDFGDTPLRYAAFNGHTAVVERLLAAGAAVDAVDNEGATPLHWAALYGQAAAVEQLLAAGAAVDAVAKGGETPYDIAKMRGHRKVMGVLDPVFVALLSGRSCRCNSAHETVQDLKEEAERKLGTTIEHLIGPDMQPLNGAMTLQEANILPGNTLTAVLDPVVLKDFGHGISMKTAQSVFDEYGPRMEVLADWKDLKDPSSLEEVLPPGHVALSQLVRLSPEDVTFPKPVEVEMPTCVGAKSVWRSSATGWERLLGAKFSDGRVVVALSHFCDVVATGPCGLKAVGFIDPHGANAKVALLHVACESCQNSLEQLCSDADMLGSFKKCGPSVPLGTYRHDEDLELRQGQEAMNMRVRFHRMPQISRKLVAHSASHFSVEIEGDDHQFEELRSEAATSATASNPTASDPPSAPATSQAMPAAAMTSDVSMAQERPERGHLLLSGRFNSDTVIDYMKAVKRRLEERRIPVYMVQAQVGQSFAELTRIGLGRAKGMVAFCTSEYGAYTGAGYETFHELEYAHDNNLYIFPIRLCEQWPPAPQNNERGTFQNRLVFKNGLVFVDDRQMNNAEGAADQIADSVTSSGIFAN